MGALFCCLLFCALVIGPVSARCDALDSFPDIRKHINELQMRSDPDCKRAKIEKQRLPSMLGGLTEQLCKMQTDNKECFYKGITVDRYLEKLRPLTDCESVAALSILEIRKCSTIGCHHCEGGLGASTPADCHVGFSFVWFVRISNLRKRLTIHHRV